MDLYTFSLILGAAGLLIMALQGFGAGHGAHGGGHAHGGHGHGHAGSHGHAHGGSHGFLSGLSLGRVLWSFASPRAWFSVLLGMGVAGHVTRPFFGGGAMLFVAAL